MLPIFGYNFLDINVDSTIGTDLIETLEKSNYRPDIIVVADGAMRHESAPNIVRDDEYLIPLFRDALTLLRRKKKTVIKLSGARFCANSAAQECVTLRKVPGFNKQGKYEFQRAPDVQHLISQLDFDEGLFDSPLVARHYADTEGSEYFIDDEYNSYYYVSMYCRRDLRWTANQRTAWANLVVAEWMNLQSNRGEALEMLLRHAELPESITRAAFGYVEKG
jgi:hypothetical protein